MFNADIFLTCQRSLISNDISRTFLRAQTYGYREFATAASNPILQNSKTPRFGSVRSFIFSNIFWDFIRFFGFAYNNDSSCVCQQKMRPVVKRIAKMFTFLHARSKPLTADEDRTSVIISTFNKIDVFFRHVSYRFKAHNGFVVAAGLETFNGVVDIKKKFLSVRRICNYLTTVISHLFSFFLDLLSVGSVLLQPLSVWLHISLSSPCLDCHNDLQSDF